MDLIRISENKLKIMLTSSDMTHYNLHNDNISIADQHVRRVMRELLAEAKNKTGFDGDMARLYIQMYPSRDGGCELFISKPDSGTDADARCTLPILSTSTQSGQELSLMSKRRRDVCVYSFKQLEDLIAACKRLDSVGFREASHAYIDHRRIYFLVLKDLPTPSLYTPDEFCFLDEYGSRENARSLQPYLSEYCSLISQENAVQKLMLL